MQQPNFEPYRVYTREFDRVVGAEDLDTVLGPLSPSDRAALEDAWDAFQNGLVSWRTNANLKALAAAARLKGVGLGERAASTAVALLVDQSGSMRGQSMILAAAAVDVAQDFLSHLGISVQVLGFTTSSWRGGQARATWTRGRPSKLWIWRRRPPRPGRLCDLLHIVYREPDDFRPWASHWSFRNMLRPDLPKENVDGEALEWASDRLRGLPQQRKLLIVISDGAPVDDSTLSANDGWILDRHLRAVVGALEASADIQLSAIGIGFDVSRYYKNSAIVTTADDLGEALISHLERVLI